MRSVIASVLLHQKVPCPSISVQHKVHVFSYSVNGWCSCTKRHRFLVLACSKECMCFVIALWLSSSSISVQNRVRVLCFRVQGWCFCTKRLRVLVSACSTECVCSVIASKVGALAPKGACPSINVQHRVRVFCYSVMAVKSPSISVQHRVPVFCFRVKGWCSGTKSCRVLVRAYSTESVCCDRASGISEHQRVQCSKALRSST